MSETRITALIIDDEMQIRRFLRVALEPHGLSIIEATTGQEGISQAASRSPQLIILDLGLPDLDGLEVLKRLREWYDRPILVLSVRDDETSIVSALDLGADDYLTKPFKLPELLARIRVAQRHYQHEDVEPIFRRGELEVNLSDRRVFVGSSEVKLTATEYDLLRVFVKNAGRVMTHAQVLKEVWGPNAREHKQYLRVYVGHLRHKIERNPSQPELLITEPGVGYRFS